ncbi:MAG: T9SS type A sorting domain-containing protein [Ignavibacteria bacterium]|nr:T9SS type A sorting domain-containing protein [Ignavibacteria bacterium]
MRTTLLVLLALLNTSLFSQSSKSKIIQSDNSSSFSSAFFKQISSLRNYYDHQSAGSPVLIWQDPSNPNNIHAVYTYSAIAFNQTYPDRTVQYFFSSDQGVTWAFVANLPTEGYKSGFGTITGLSNGNALIALHTVGSNNIQRTQIFADVFPGLGSFVLLDPGGLNDSKYIWPAIIATNNVSLTNKFIFTASGQGFGGDTTFINIGKSLSTNSFGGYKPINSKRIENNAIGKGSDGRIGIVYTGWADSIASNGDLFFIESTNNGDNFSAPLKIYNCDYSTDTMGVLLGVSIVYQNNSPKVIFTTGNVVSELYYNIPSKIRFWSPTLSGSDPSKSIVIADQNNVPFYPADAGQKETSLCFPSIGVSADNQVLFTSILAQSSTLGTTVPPVRYNDIYLARSFNGGSNWLTPERITPLSPRNDWTFASISPSNDCTTDNYFVNMVIQKDTVPGAGINVTGGYDGNTNAHPYFVRVGFSRVASPPGPPTLTFPANGASNVSLMPDLTWSPNGVNYHLQISTNAGFSNIVHEQNSLSFSHYTIPIGILNSSSTYYWRISSLNEFGEGGFSSAFSFTTTSQTIPSAPILISPVGGASNVPLKPQLDWNDVPGASSYRVLLSLNRVFTLPIVLDSSGASSSVLNVPFYLFPMMKYYWKVNASNVAGTGVYSVIDSFTMGDLDSPVLVSPIDSALTTSSVNLIWNAVPPAEYHKYQISEFADFHTLFSNGSTVNTNVTVSNLPLHIKYYWRVRGVKDAGLGTPHEGPFSQVRSFTTAISPPSLVSPTNGQQGVLLNPTLVWNSVAGRTGYSFIVSRSSSFTDTVYTNTSDTTNYTLPTNLLEINTLYYWKVRSRDSVGYGIYSSPRSFRSRLTGVLNNISEIIPAEFKLFTNYPNPFNPTTKIKFDLPKNSSVKINIFDITGKMINEIINMNLNAGSYETEYNGANLSSGIYYYRIEAGSFVETKKMILIK